MSRPPRSLVSNTLASGVATAWIALATLISVPVLIRHLGPDEYGIWVLVSLLAVSGRGIGSLLDLGLQQSLIHRLAVVDPAEAGRRLGAALRTTATAAALLIPVGLLAADPIVGLFDLSPGSEGAARTALRLMVVQVAVEILAQPHASALEARRRYELRRSLDAARITAFTVGAVLVVLGGGGVAAVSASSLLATLGWAVAIASSSRRIGMVPRRGGAARDELRHGLPLLALRATGVFYRQIDKIVLGLVIGSVGAAGMDVVEKANLVPLTVIGVVTSALIPAAAVSLAADRSAAGELVVQATAWTALLTLPVIGLTAGIAGPLVSVVAGSELPGTHAGVLWLLASTALIVVNGAGFEMVIGAGGGRRLAPVTLIATAANVGLTIVLARRFGLPGATAATFVVIGGQLPFTTTITARTFGVPVRTLVSACLGPALVGVIVFVVSWTATAGGNDTSALVRGGLAGGLALALAAVMPVPGRPALIRSVPSVPKVPVG